MSVLFVNSKGIDGRPATAAWADAGTARRHVSAAEFQARESAGEKVSIVDLNPADPFWVLPVVGGA